jgi:murein DD-endopeptidase MepM/ murein hydrolase activator NlpD
VIEVIWATPLYEFLRRCNATSCILLVFLFSRCTPPAITCPPQTPADLSGALAYAQDEQLVFRFPLDELGNDVRQIPAIFCSSGGSGSAREYHAAEDYFLPAGTPVYAIADGNISFSGPMGGYGWLIIIDHPQANIYSLYGHLSPSRWRLESGPVEKGDLIAYLGDPDENGGSPAQPLITHLHFGIRAGQRTDYPGMGEWRWQAGWIKPCPQDLGWLQPSGIITGQEIPPGGFREPTAGLLEKWGVELAFISVYLFAGAGMLVFAILKNKPILPVMYGGFMIIAGWVLFDKGTRTSYALFSMAALAFVFAIFQFIRNSKKLPTANQSNLPNL